MRSVELAMRRMRVRRITVVVGGEEGAVVVALRCRIGVTALFFGKSGWTDEVQYLSCAKKKTTLSHTHIHMCKMKTYVKHPWPRSRRSCSSISQTRLSSPGLTISSK